MSFKFNASSYDGWNHVLLSASTIYIEVNTWIKPCTKLVTYLVFNLCVSSFCSEGTHLVTSSACFFVLASARPFQGCWKFGSNKPISSC